MSAINEEALAAVAEPRPALRRRWRPALGVSGIVAVAVILVLIVIAVFAPWIAPQKALDGSVLEAHQPPSGTHLLGTDQSGRDLLSRLIFGARTSLGGPALIVVLTALMGTLFALVASWCGGWVDAAIGRLLDLLFAFPSLLLAIIVVAVFGGGLTQAAVALAVAYAPYTARVLRSVSLRERRLGYVQAAELQGMRGFTVAVRHILPNIAPQIATGAAINFGYAMIDLAAISFLGLGVQPPAPDWGLMVAGGQDSLVQGYPQQSLLAGACIVVAVVAFGVVGERLGGRKAGGRR
jgi:peptide/nickel transport system permease protein